MPTNEGLPGEVIQNKVMPANEWFPGEVIYIAWSCLHARILGEVTVHIQSYATFETFIIECLLF
jgi:hypothetical protein